MQVVGTGGSGFLTGVSAIAAGSASLHTLALKPDGSVWAWGYGGSGQLGNGGFASSSTPVQVLGVTGGPFTGVATIAAGFDHSLAIKGDGTAWAWGDDTHGQLGNGATTNSASPVQILGVGGAQAIWSRRPSPAVSTTACRLPYPRQPLTSSPALP